jgi:hypothetical protein
MQRASWKQRGLGAALALLVQAGFVLLVLLSPHSHRSASLPRETILLFPPRVAPAPSTIDARGPRRKRSIAPGLTPVPPPAVTPPSAAPSLAPPSGLAGFGRSLFGCTPENYAALTPDEREHCPKPGEGLARNNDRELLTGPRGHAKDEAMWQEKWAEDHWVPVACLPGAGPGATAQCLMAQGRDENHRAAAAWDKIATDRAAAAKAKAPPLPNVRQRQTAK